MLYRINRAVLSVATCLLLFALVAAEILRHAEPKTVIAAAQFARPWLVATIALGLFPVLSWPAIAVVRLARRRRLVWSGAVGFVWLILTANLLFWGSVQADVPIVNRLFEQGRLFWLGQRAFLFGHGYWKITDGYWQHQTVVRLADGTVYRGPTLDLLAQLHERGASFVWGTWCYTGNYPYIQMDLITGRREPWPSYASYNRTAGITIPIWVGSSFVRLGWPRDRYTSEPPTFGTVAPDTLVLTGTSADRVEQAFSLIRRRTPGLPRPDSVSWQPVQRDTVWSLSRRDLLELSESGRHKVREWELSELERQTNTGLALYWVGGRALPVFVRISAVLRRTLERPDFEAAYGSALDWDEASIADATGNDAARSP